MNLFDILKQFHTIESDVEMRERSRRAILAMPQYPAPKSFWGVLRVLEAGVATALVGFFILLMTGTFSSSPYLSPVQYSVVDPASLHAEAQAIDIQIQLANLNYPQAAIAVAKSTTSSVASVKPSALKTASSTKSQAGTSASGTAPETLSIDEALTQLSQ